MTTFQANSTSAKKIGSTCSDSSLPFEQRLEKIEKERSDGIMELQPRSSPFWVAITLICVAVLLLQATAFFATKPADVYERVNELQDELNERPTRAEFHEFLQANPQLNPPQSMRISHGNH